MSYKTKINTNLELISGITYAPESNLTSNNQRIISTITINSSTGTEFPVNSFEANLDALGLKSTDLTLPSRFSFGAGIGKPRSWFVGGEYTAINSSKFFNPLYSSLTTKYEDGYNVSFGGFFILFI